MSNMNGTNRSLAKPSRARGIATGRATTFSLVACIGLISSAAGAESNMALTSRESVNLMEYSGGFAIIAEKGADGSSLPVTTFKPQTLSISGSDFMPIHYTLWDGYLSESWTQSQTYTLLNTSGGARLQASGAAKMIQESEVCGPSGCNLATEQHFSTNTQAFEFTLSGPTRYDLETTTRGGQYVDLFVWNSSTGRWSQLVFGALANIDTTWSKSGPLGTGLYRIANDPYRNGGGYDRDIDNAWSYTLTLADAVTTTPVPEPGAWLLILAGLGVLAGRRDGRNRR